MWLARRSPAKPIDLGLPITRRRRHAAGASADTLAKEAWKGIEAGRASSALLAGAVHICRDQSDGLQRETVHVHDLWLPAEFVPQNQDGEAVEHRLCNPDEVLALIATDEVTADASLVIVDFLLRHGHIPRDDAGFAALEALRHPPVSSLHR
jgi:hypothetical protein